MGSPNDSVNQANYNDTNRNNGTRYLRLHTINDPQIAECAYRK